MRGCDKGTWEVAATIRYRKAFNYHSPAAISNSRRVPEFCTCETILSSSFTQVTSVLLEIVSNVLSFQ